MINRGQLADTLTADRKDENSSPLPSCQRYEDEFGEPEMCGPLCIVHTTPNKKNDSKASGNWTLQYEIRESLRQLDISIWNTRKPQAIGWNKIKIPICLRQLDIYKKKEHKDSGYRLHRNHTPSNRRLRGCSNFWRQETFRRRRNHSFGCESTYSEGVMPNVSLKHLEK